MRSAFAFLGTAVLAVLAVFVALSSAAALTDGSFRDARVAAPEVDSNSAELNVHEVPAWEATSEVTQGDANGKIKYQCGDAYSEQNNKGIKWPLMGGSRYNTWGIYSLTVKGCRCALYNNLGCSGAKVTAESGTNGNTPWGPKCYECVISHLSH